MTGAFRPELGEALGRLLGPAEAELACDECFAALDVYVEAELAGRDADQLMPGMRAHLEGCPACREEHATLRALAARPSPPPPTVEQDEQP